MGWTLQITNCNEFGNFDDQTGLWKLGRTTVLGVERDRDWAHSYSSRDWREDVTSWKDDTCLFQMSGDWGTSISHGGDDGKCVRIKFRDDDCGTEYTSDCIPLSSCPVNIETTFVTADDNVDARCLEKYPDMDLNFCSREPSTEDFNDNEDDDNDYIKVNDDDEHDWRIVGMGYGLNFDGGPPWWREDSDDHEVITYNHNWQRRPRFGTGWYESVDEDQPLCLRIRVKDYVCSRFYTSNCLNIGWCWWD